MPSLWNDAFYRILQVAMVYMYRTSLLRSNIVNRFNNMIVLPTNLLHKLKSQCAICIHY